MTWLLYAFGIPVLSYVHFRLSANAFDQLFILGETGQAPQVRHRIAGWVFPILGVPFILPGFPILFPVLQVLLWSQDRAALLLMGLNSLTWASFLIWAGIALFANISKGF
ncbi:MAG: hypothetical protein JWN70_4268 [Planctomycetaceae bacterium]|nr:hypothetical protein [Planctomycetaceae bacterium]